MIRESRISWLRFLCKSATWLNIVIASIFWKTIIVSKLKIFFTRACPHRNSAVRYFCVTSSNLTVR
jgi:hypothetical protein